MDDLQPEPPIDGISPSAIRLSDPSTSTVSHITPADFGSYLNRPRSLWHDLARFAGHRLRDRLEGEDVAQETIARVYEAVRRGARIPPAAFRRYCFTTACRLVLSRLRYRDSHPRDALDARSDTASATIEDLPAPDENCAEVQLLIGAALERLPERERLVTELTLAGYEDQEIARLAGISSAGNVRQIRFRAIERLHRSFASTSPSLTGTGGCAMV